MLSRSMTDECVVCYYDTSNTLDPCNHRVCRDCIGKWFSRKVDAATCPVCRGDVGRAGLRPLCGGTSVVVTFASGGHAGITYTTKSNGETRLTSLKSGDRGSECGLVVGDVVTHLNGIQVNSSTKAARITNVCSSHRLDMVVTLERSPPNKRRPFFCFARRTLRETTVTD